MLRRLGTLLFLTLAACVPQRPAAVEPPPSPAAFLEQGDASPATPAGRWWLAFADPALDALQAELFAGNPGLEQAFARLAQARAQARVARAARLPTLAVEGEAGRAMQPGPTGDFTGDSRRLSAGAGFELDLWGKLAARSEASRREAEARREELQTLYLGLSAELADLYYLAVEQRSQLALSERTVASFADTVERVERRYRQGLVPAVDLYQARQSLAAAQAARPSFEAALAAAEHAVAVLLGRYPDRASAGTLATLPTLPASFAVGLPSDLIARRPDLRAALRRVEAADARVAAAIADRFPSFDLLAAYGDSRLELATGLLAGDFWSLLGNVVLPVVDGGRRRAEVARSEAVLRESVARYRQAVLDAFREVEDALAGSRAAEARIAALQETEAATSAALRLSTDRYLGGLSDYLPVLTAQRSLLEVQSRLLSARRQLISERIALARALGGEWMAAAVDERLTSARDKGTDR